jgi:succinate dehydrogenase / fumarate reductase cytochrome b subunit
MTFAAATGRTSTAAPIARVGSVPLKFAVGASSLFLIAFVVGHLAGNLLVFRGPEALNAYAKWLREHAGLLWGSRIVLLIAVMVHIGSSLRLAARNRAARPVRYAAVQATASTWASRTMVLTGPMIAAYVAYHLLHLTFGAVHPDFRPGDVYRNVVVGFQQPAVSAVYAIAMVFLGFHLAHGVWSVFQTFGLSNDRWEPRLRRLAIAFAAAITVGYLSIPGAVLAGWISTPAP